MEQRIGFLYLKTGGGHISGATALIDRLAEKYPQGASYILKNGFKEKNRLARIFFEKGYLATSNYFEEALFARKVILERCLAVIDGRSFVVNNIGGNDVFVAIA